MIVVLWHGEIAGPDNLGDAGPTPWQDMIADVNPLSGESLGVAA